MFQEIKGLAVYCSFYYFLKNKMKVRSTGQSKEGKGGVRVRGGKRDANSSCLTNLKGTSFRNENCFFLIHNLGEVG